MLLYNLGSMTSSLQQQPDPTAQRCLSLPIYLYHALLTAPLHPH